MATGHEIGPIVTVRKLNGEKEKIIANNLCMKELQFN